MRAPSARWMKRGVPPTARKARTAELTPPTSTWLARSNSCWLVAWLMAIPDSRPHVRRWQFQRWPQAWSPGVGNALIVRPCEPTAGFVSKYFCTPVFSGNSGGEITLIRRSFWQVSAFPEGRTKEDMSARKAGSKWMCIPDMGAPAPSSSAPQIRGVARTATTTDRTAMATEMAASCSPPLREQAHEAAMWWWLPPGRHRAAFSATVARPRPAGRRAGIIGRSGSPSGNRGDTAPSAPHHDRRSKRAAHPPWLPPDNHGPWPSR